MRQKFNVIKNNKRDISVIIVFMIIMVTGFLLRIYKLNQISLWFDEAYGYIHANRSISDVLFKPVCCHPPANSFLIHIWMSVFGDSEFMLRLPAVLLGSTAGLFIFSLTKKYTSSIVALFSLAIYMYGSRFIYQSRELNPYGLVMFISCFILWFIDKYQNTLSIRQWLLLSFVIFLGLMTHYGMLLWVISIGLALILEIIIKQLTRQAPDIGKSVKLLSASFLPIFLFGVFFITITAKQIDAASAPHINNQWSLKDAYLQYFNSIISSLFYGNNKTSYWLIGFMVLGWFAFLFNNRTRWFGFVWIFSSSIPYILFVNNRYLFADRYLLFSTIIICFMIANGFYTIIRFFRYVSDNIAIVASLVIPIILVASMMINISRTSNWYKISTSGEEMKPVFQCISQKYQRDDDIYVYYGAKYAFIYYNRSLNWSHTLGTWKRGNPSGIIREIKTMPPDKRIWLIFSHVIPANEDQQVIDLYDDDNVILDTCSFEGASAVLFTNK